MTVSRWSSSRRAFLATAAAASSMSRVLGANDRIPVAVVGLGGRGNDHMKELAAQPDCEIVAVCDVNQAAQERAVALVEKLTNRKPAVFSDQRKLYEDKSVAAVSIATPNHWHALCAIWACQAGKHVYIEKPACHSPWEGQRMIDAAKKYKRIVQVGMQSRSIGHKQKAAQLLQEGVIGKLYLTKSLCYKRRKSIGKTPAEAVPPGVNWDMFLGPAPKHEFTQNRFKYNWHWFWDTGNGDIGNQGVHEIDVARWGMGKNGLPKSVAASGGKFAYDDDQETPNVETAILDYGDSQMVIEVNGILPGDVTGIPLAGGNVIGDLYYGSEGYLAMDWNGFKVYKGEKRELAMEQKYMEPHAYDSAPHFENFLKAVKANDASVLHAPIEVGVLSANLCHYANTSYRVGRKLMLDPNTGAIQNDAEATAMLKRAGRAPYVIPEKV